MMKFKFKKMTIESKRLTYRALWIILFLITASITGFYTLKFFVSFHNLDMCQNLQFIEDNVNKKFCEYGINESYGLQETTLDGYPYDLKECYREGIFGILYNFILVMINSLITGFVFCTMLLPLRSAR